MKKKPAPYKSARYYAIPLLRMGVDEVVIHVSMVYTVKWIKKLLKDAGLKECDYDYKYHRKTEEDSGHWHLYKRVP